MLAAAERVPSDRLEPPPDPRSHWDLAHAMRLPDGPHKGELWRPETEPTQVAWVRSLDDTRYNKRTRVAPAQRGKSLESIALPLVRTLIELAQNAVYIMPNLDKLNQNWEGKVRPLLVGCGYGAYLPEKGPGSKGGRPAAITLRHPDTGDRLGTWYFLAGGGGGKETSLASVTALLSATDEADDFESEGHLKLGEKRAASYGDAGQAIVTSTVNDRKGRDGHPVLSHYRLGTRTRLWFQCPACAGTGATAGFQLLRWDQVRGLEAPSIAEVRANVRYECEHCRAQWTDRDRRAALRSWREVHEGQTVDAGGRVAGDAPMSRHYSLLSTDLDYNMSSLESMAEDYWVAKRAIDDRGDHSLMRVFFYKRLCEDYTGDREQQDGITTLEWRDILTRAQLCAWGPSIHLTDRGAVGDGYTYSRHHADPPPEANFVVGGVDVQQNRVYWVLTACTLDGTSYDFAWGYEYARPDKTPWNDGELIALMDRTDIVLHKHADKLPLVLVGLDTSFATDQLRGWLRSRPRGGPWRACKGEDQPARKVGPGDVEGIVYHGERELLVVVPHTRALVQAALLRPNGQPGAIHLPNGLRNTASDRAYPQHLVGEKVVIDRASRKERLVKTGRWDWLDARRYAYAMMRLHQQALAMPKRPPPVGTAEPSRDWIPAGPGWDIGSL